MFSSFDEFSCLGNMYADMYGGGPPPDLGNYYVAEDGVSQYVAENGTDPYVPET